MTTKLTLTVEIDTDKWAEEYGLNRGDVREDAISYIKTTLYGTEAPIVAVRTRGEA